MEPISYGLLDISQVHVLKVANQLGDDPLVLATLDPLEEARILLVEVVFTTDAFHRYADLFDEGFLYNELFLSTAVPAPRDHRQLPDVLKVEETLSRRAWGGHLAAS